VTLIDAANTAGPTVGDGRRDLPAVSVTQATRMLGARGAALDALLERAGELRDEGARRAGRPGVVTYSRKVFIPLTTLCRDRCHYCAFVDTPAQLRKKRQAPYMDLERVLAVARQGSAAGCKEALLTLGDRPEDRWPEAREWLDAHGYASTIDYVADMARAITAETGLLCHANPGVMSPEELRTLRRVAPSMGMMLETTSRRLYEQRGEVHFGSPDKDPDLRLAVIAQAGRARVPFTTGILVGIGETVRERAESLIALREAHAAHGHLQEVIVQNFRAKPRTAMSGHPDADLSEFIAAIATARIVMGPDVRIQVPPNLTDAAELELVLRAGADDWGGVSPLTADHVNPERPWPHLADLAAATRDAGFVLQERLTAQPPYILDPEGWIDPALRAAVAAHADPVSGLARAAGAPRAARGAITDRGLRALADAAAADPRSLDDAEWALLLDASGDELETVVRVADEVRRFTVGEAVSIVVNRNLASSGFGAPAGGHGIDLATVAGIAADAWERGATELCVQGRLPAGASADGYPDLLRAVSSAAPRLHLHAYRPQDVCDFADRAGIGVAEALRRLHAAGMRSMPGTGVKVLNERVRAAVAPDDVEIDRWVDTVETAHGLGLRSSSVLVYGSVETARERIAHLRALRRIQDRTGGFTEFVPMPTIGPLRPLRPGRGERDEHRAMVAVSRLLLSGSIPHIQIPWTRHSAETVGTLLGAGGDDLGGTLLDGRVRPDAGAEAGRELPMTSAAALVAPLFRPLRQRTTLYQEPPADRKVAPR